MLTQDSQKSKEQNVKKTEIKDLKKQMRQEVKEQIAGLTTAYKEEADRKITEYLLSLTEYQKANTVFAFVGVDHEINTRPFLRQVLEDGKRLAVPLCRSLGVMEAREIMSLDELQLTKMGLWEPTQEAPLVKEEELEFAVIPCLSCDHQGNRLGHGGGFYDRYFEKIPDTPSVVICRDKITREDIPLEEHDFLFSRVITEEGIYNS